MELLPMDHVDIIVLVKGEFTYFVDDECILIDCPHVHGIRDKSIGIEQSDYVKTWGISFTPWGFHLFNDLDMTRVAGKVNKLADVSPDLNRHIEGVKDLPIDVIIKSLEGYLLDQVKKASDHSLVKVFIEGDATISDFCESVNLNRRTFERMFRKHIGASPKAFRGIKKFENSSRAILYDEQVQLSELAYAQEYYDQAQFNKSFKAYSSYTPGEFIKKQPTLKSKMTFK